MANATETEQLVNDELGVRVDLNTRRQFPVSLPLGLVIAIEQQAKETNTSAGEIARAAIAKEVGYTGPLGGKVTRSSMSEEEKDKRNKARSAARANLMKDMAAKYGVALGEGKKKKAE